MNCWFLAQYYITNASGVQKLPSTTVHGEMQFNPFIETHQRFSWTCDIYDAPVANHLYNGVSLLLCNSISCIFCKILTQHNGLIHCYRRPLAARWVWLVWTTKQDWNVVRSPQFLVFKSEPRNNKKLAILNIFLTAGSRACIHTTAHGAIHCARLCLAPPLGLSPLTYIWNSLPGSCFCDRCGDSFHRKLLLVT